MKSNPLSFYIRTYGCQMNELDSEVMRGILLKKGFLHTDDEEMADICIFNTCSIRDLAERKVLGKIGQLARKRRKKPIIGVTGCMASLKKETLLQKIPHIDFVLGTNDIHLLPYIIDEVINKQSRVTQVSKKFSTELDYSVSDRKDPIKASVSIIRGCNNFCTYCVVPYSRGPEVSRDPQSIIDECAMLVEKGYKEITLLGQNVNSYGKDIHNSRILFPDLLYRLDAIPGMCRIRFLTSQPMDISPLLIDAVKDLKTVCEFVHFPIQSGSNRILQKMARRYTKEEYFEKAALFREKIPHVALGTDIIVGFPTETEEDFSQTLTCMEQLRYTTAFLFAYSPRKNTPAYRFVDDVSKEEKESRLARIIAHQDKIQASYLQSLLEQTVEVLVEGTSTKDASMLKGTTRTWKNVVFEGEKALIGTLQNVKISSFCNSTAIGKIV